MSTPELRLALIPEYSTRSWLILGAGDIVSFHGFRQKPKRSLVLREYISKGKANQNTSQLRESAG